MFKHAIPLLIAAVSSVVMEVAVVIPAVGGFYNFLKLSDFGKLTVAFHVQPAWATANVALALVGVASMWLCSDR